MCIRDRNFTEQQPYTGQFADVPPDAWYAENVELAYEYGLINGVSQTSFAPDNSLTMAEAVKLAACLHSIYQNGATDFAASSPWYTVYAAYALENGILSAPLESYEAAATRGAFADVLAKAFPEEALEQVNSVEMCIRDSSRIRAVRRPALSMSNGCARTATSSDTSMDTNRLTQRRSTLKISGSSDWTRSPSHWRPR